MKISILIYDLSNNCLVRTYPIAKVLEKHYELEFIGPSLKGGVFKPYENEFEYKTIKGSFWYPGLYNMQKRMRDAVTGDVVYAFKPKTTSLLPGLMKKRRDGTPLVLDIEDWEYAISSQKLLKSIASYACLPHYNSLTYLALLERLAAKADERIVATRFLEDKFSGVYIPHGTDTGEFDPAKYEPETIRNEYDLKDETVVMFTGTPNPYKGITELVSSVMKANEEGIPTKLMIVGGDTSNDYVRKLMKSESVIVTGFQPHERMPEFLAAADIIALPQKRNRITSAQIPGKVFEAMAMAKPIIATDVSDLSEILEGCGIIVPPEDDAQLGSALAKLAGDEKLREKLGEAARKQCIERYSWKAMEKDLKKVFSRFER